MSTFFLNEAAEAAVYAWVKSQLPTYNVIWAYASAEDTTLARRPQLPICELNISWVRDSDASVDQAYVGDGVFEYSSVVAFTLQINVYTNSGHMAAMSKLRKSLMLPTVIETIRKAGLASWKKREPNDLSAAEGGKYELRSQMEVEFSYIQTVQDSPGEINSVHAEFFIDDEKISDITIL